MIGGTGFEEWRIGKRRLVYLPRFPNQRIFLQFPRAEAVFLSWLRTKGWDVELSSSGQIAKQMLKKLGGIWGISFLANSKLINLLRKMAKVEIMLEREVRAEAHRIVNEKPLTGDANWLIQGLTERNMIRLGFQIKCPACQRDSWHALDALNYIVTCEKCLDKFSVPTHTPDSLKWAYRIHGPFSLPKGGQGA